MGRIAPPLVAIVTLVGCASGADSTTTTTIETTTTTTAPASTTTTAASAPTTTTRAATTDPEGSELQTVASPSDSAKEISRAVTTLDGRRVGRTVTTVEEGLYPEGTEVTTYLVDLTTDGTEQTLVATTPSLGDYDYERNVNLLHEMVRTIELDQPGREGLIASYRGGGTPFDVIAEASGSETCLIVDPGAAQACLDAPTGNRVDAAIADGALVGLAGPDVSRIEVANGISFLPVPTGTGTAACAVPLEGSSFDVLGSDGSGVLIEVDS